MEAMYYPLAEEEEADDELKPCIICLDHPRTLRFVPCGHANCCDTCVLRLIETSPDHKLACPMCKTAVTFIQASATADVPIARQKTFKPVRDISRTHPHVAHLPCSDTRGPFCLLLLLLLLLCRR